MSSGEPYSTIKSVTATDSAYNALLLKENVFNEFELYYVLEVVVSESA